MVVSINWSIPNGWFIMEKTIKMDDLRVPQFVETTICLFPFWFHIHMTEPSLINTSHSCATRRSPQKYKLVYKPYEPQLHIHIVYHIP